MKTFHKVKMHIWDASYARLRTMVPKVIQNMVMPNPSVGSVARIISEKNVVSNVSIATCMGIFKIIVITTKRIGKRFYFSSTNYLDGSMVNDETMMVEHLNCICDLECHIFGGGKVPKKRLPIINKKVLIEEIVESKEHPQDIVK
jgi:hypothetical protein